MVNNTHPNQAPRSPSVFRCLSTSCLSTRVVFTVILPPLTAVIRHPPCVYASTAYTASRAFGIARESGNEIKLTDSYLSITTCCTLAKHAHAGTHVRAVYNTQGSAPSCSPSRLRKTPSIRQACSRVAPVNKLRTNLSRLMVKAFQGGKC